MARSGHILTDCPPTWQTSRCMESSGRKGGCGSDATGNSASKTAVGLRSSERSKDFRKKRGKEFKLRPLERYGCGARKRFTAAARARLNFCGRTRILHQAGFGAR